jgi:hypothetical protein
VAFPLPGPRPPIPEAFAQNGWNRWVELVGDHGTVHRALRRDEEGGGFTLVGEGVVDAVDPANFGDGIKAAIADRDEWMAEFRLSVPVTFEVLTFSAWSDMERRPAPLKEAGSFAGDGFDPGEIDGATLAWRVTRGRACAN